MRNNSTQRELVIYLFVGFAGTIISWLAAYVGKLILNPGVPIENAIINIFSWVVGVLSAYPMNRKWVFRSNNPILKEFSTFVASRISTLLCDVFIMWFTVNVLNMEYWTAKIFISTVFVTVANYVISKLFIFTHKK